MSKRPGAFMSDIKVSSKFFERQLYTSPPDDWIVNPFFGIVEPVIPRLIAKLGVEDIIKRLIFETNFAERRVGVSISERDANYLTYDQRWIIQCNILWTIHGFLGRPMTHETIDTMKRAVHDVIRWLASIEYNPGDFGQNDIG